MPVALCPKLVVTRNFLRLQRSPPKWEQFFRPRSKKLKLFPKSLQCDEDARRSLFHSPTRQSQALHPFVVSLMIHSQPLTEVKRMSNQMSSLRGFRRLINSRFFMRKGANSTSSQRLWRRSLTPMISRRGSPMLLRMRPLRNAHLQARHPMNQQGTDSRMIHRRGNRKRHRHRACMKSLFDSNNPRSTSLFPRSLLWCPPAR